MGPASNIPIYSPTYKIDGPATSTDGDEPESAGASLMRRLSRTTKTPKSLHYSTKSGAKMCPIEE